MTNCNKPFFSVTFILGVEQITRKAFMAEFTNLLAFMNDDERDRAVRRYEQMFDQAGPEREEELTKSFGSPIRLVLQLEEEYRLAKREGKIPFLDMVEESPEQGNEVPAVEEQPDDIVMTVRQAADALADLPASDEPVFPSDESSPIGSVDDSFPIGELAYAENADDFFEDSDPERPDGEEVLPEMTSPEERPEGLPEEKTAEETAAAAEEDTPEKEMGFHDPADDRQSSKNDLFSETGTDEDGDADEDEAAPTRASSPGAARIFAAILVTVPFIALWIVGFALFLALGAAVMAVGFAACAAGVYFAGYVMSGLITFLPDLLLVAGAALGCFALALLFIWTGLWIAAGGCICVVRMTAGVYRAILMKKLPEEDEEDE